PAQQRHDAQADVAAAEYQQARLAEPATRMSVCCLHVQDCMTFQVTVKPSGRQFPCEADETILNAAIRAGIGLPYGCKNGACSTCRGSILEGDVHHGPHQERALSAADEAKGFALFCCAKPY